jgi:hypothetical protein
MDTGNSGEVLMESIARNPTEHEVEGIMETARVYWGLTKEEMPAQGYIAIFDHYITDCPGYSGMMAVVVWGGSPNYLDSLIVEDGKWKMLDKDDVSARLIHEKSHSCDGDCNCPDCEVVVEMKE